MVLLVTKFYNDEYADNKTVASVMELTMQKVFEIEIFVFMCLDCEVYVDPQAYQMFKKLHEKPPT